MQRLPKATREVFSFLERKLFMNFLLFVRNIASLYTNGKTPEDTHVPLNRNELHDEIRKMSLILYINTLMVAMTFLSLSFLFILGHNYFVRLENGLLIEIILLTVIFLFSLLFLFNRLMALRSIASTKTIAPSQAQFSIVIDNFFENFYKGFNKGYQSEIQTISAKHEHV